MVKALHVLFVFIWVGNLLALTRLMGYHVKEDPDTQLRLGRLYRRMYYLVGLPSLVLALTFGLISLMNVDWSYKTGWFHMKLTFVVLMFLADAAVAGFVKKLSVSPDKSRGVPYKVAHGIVGIALIGILCSVYLVRDKEGEILHQKEIAAKK